MNRLLSCAAAAAIAAGAVLGTAVPASSDAVPAAAQGDQAKSCDDGLGGITKHFGVKVCPTLDGAGKG
ncbi:hypothetical protein ACFOVU_23850 [Nocardiopsis sediminis]|uniref:Secreted protein n=1 Tax=Nocardiopsis sediminis TaxID=1778267 RepID=A0ABV8FS93_9ACTN